MGVCLYCYCKQKMFNEAKVLCFLFICSICYEKLAQKFRFLQNNFINK
jgi:pentatricopeptide repeat protein